MRDSSDWNLLVGLLAWQNGLVSWEDLSRGLKAAALPNHLGEIGESLGEKLVALGALRQEQLDNLLPLVDAHLHLNGNDPNRALRSAGGQLSGSAAELLSTLKRHVDDNELQQSLELTTLASMAEDRNGPPSDHPIHPASNRRLISEAGRFRILRPHAKGGLGEVFVARDDSLNRNVAVKEIQDKFSDNTQSRERFLLEAEVTGRLEHPGIVPVYALGQYDDGRPYYAMRFIKGDSLKEAIAEYHRNTDADASDRRLLVRDLLKRFVDVCQSISYAHSRGVLHRDLKPGNIMLGKYGETLVVDWGLARVMQEGQELEETTDGNSMPIEGRLQPPSGSQVTPTIMGSAIGTPAYMPPEQAAGDLAAMGPASDVYSLGATLFHLLTGKPPFHDGNVGQILDKVKRGEFLRPVLLAATVPRALDAICIKAMALRPEDRYENPLDLARDIERYLADEPVLAFPDPWLVRVRRWARKHQTLTVATASCVLLTAVGLAVVSAVVGQKNTQLVKLNTALDTKNVELAESNASEKSARQAAEANALIAKRQSELALSTLTGVIADLQYGLANVSGSGPVRQMLLETSIAKLQEVSTSFIQQASVDYETAEALLQMGLLVQDIVIDNTEGENASQSAMETAAAFVDQAHAIAYSLQELYPDNGPVRSLLSRTFLATGQLASNGGDVLGAIQRFEAGLATGKLAIDAGTGSGLDLAIFHESIGGSRLSLGELEAALESFQRSVDLYQSGQAEGADFDPNIIFAQARIAYILSRQGKLSEAIKQMRSAVEIAEQAVEAEPDNAMMRSKLIDVQLNLAEFLRLGGDVGPAMVLLSEALTTARQLRNDDPSNTNHSYWLASTLDKVGDIYLGDGLAEKSIPVFEEALGIWKQLNLQSPQNTSYRSAIGASMMRLGDSLALVGDVEGTRQRYQALLDTYKPLSEDAPDDVEAQRALATAYERMALLHEHEGKLDLAADEYQQMLAIKEKLLAESPGDSLALHELAITHRHIGGVAELQGQAETALEEFRTVSELSDRLVQLDPNKAANRIELANSYQRMAESLIVLERFDEAGGAFSNAAKVYRSMIEDRISAPQAKASLAEVQEDMYAAKNGKLATGAFAEILKRPRDEQRKLLIVRGIIATRTRDASAMEETAVRFQELDSPSADELYRAGALLALICDQIADLSDERRKELGKQAMDLVERSVLNGLQEPAQLQFDTDLRYLWTYPRFQQLVEPALR